MSDTKIDDGGPAFPCPDDYAQDGGPLYGPRNIQGMTLRDWFAGQALAGLLSDPCGATREQCLKHGVDPDSKTAQAQIYATVAYAYSDAMIAAKKEKA